MATVVPIDRPVQLYDVDKLWLVGSCWVGVQPPLRRESVWFLDFIESLLKQSVVIEGQHDVVGRKACGECSVQRWCLKRLSCDHDLLDCVTRRNDRSAAVVEVLLGPNQTEKML